MIVAEKPIIDKHEELQRQYERARGSDPLEVLLENWARWCRMASINPEFHVECRSVGKGFTHYGETDYDRQLDMPRAETIDAIVWHDLTNFERGAVNIRYLGGVWPWAEVDMAEELESGKEKVRAACIRKGVLTP